MAEKASKRFNFRWTRPAIEPIPIDKIPHITNIVAQIS
jgi:hypothetical protein